MAKPTFTDILFCYTFSIIGLLAFCLGTDAALYSNYHGAGLFVAIVGLIMLGVAATESGKL